MRSLTKLCCSVALFCLASGLQAEDNDYLTVGAGAFEIVDSDRDEAAITAGYRFAPRLWDEHLGPMFNGIGPAAGMMATEEGGLYGYGGIFADIRPTENTVLWPTAGLGGYRQGNSISLGGTFQFYLELFLGYRLTERHMLGLSYQHISNAGIHRANPASDSVFFTYTATLPALFN